MAKYSLFPRLWLKNRSSESPSPVYPAGLDKEFILSLQEQFPEMPRTDGSTAQSAVLNGVRIVLIYTLTDYQPIHVKYTCVQIMQILVCILFAI